MIRNLIFDFDRTLFDSYPHIAAAFCRTLRNHGIEYRERDVMDALFISFWEAAERYHLTEAQEKEFIACNADHDFPPAVVPYDGVPEMLRALKDGGFRLFLYSHSTTEKVNHYYDKYRLTDFFEESVTADHGFAHKPSPEAVDYLLQKYRLRPEETLMIGDRALDILAGKNARVPGCLILWGTPPQTDAADYYLQTVTELPALLARLNEKEE